MLQPSIFLLASCEQVPKMCKVVYDNTTTVYMKSTSYPVGSMQKECFPKENDKDKCYQVWNTITCHLAYPKCAEAEGQNKLRTPLPLCRNYCHMINNVTSACPILKECNQSHFIYQLNMDCSNLPETNCISAGEYNNVSLQHMTLTTFVIHRFKIGGRTVSTCSKSGSWWVIMLGCIL